MTRTLRVAAAQDVSRTGDVPANVATAVALVRSAGRNRARVVVLPELFLTGYDPAAWAPGHGLSLDDPRLVPLRQIASAHEMVVVAGAAIRRSSSSTTLSLLVFDGDELSAPYDKQHLFADERAFFRAGDHGASITVDGWELGLGICYDGCFPEHAAAAAADGASAYLCPSAYYVGSDHRRDLYYAARALDNGFYVVYSGLAGRCGDREFSGGSTIYDPEGRAVDRVRDQTPALVFADLDADELRSARELNPLGRDRLAGLGQRRLLVLGV